MNGGYPYRSHFCMNDLATHFQGVVTDCACTCRPCQEAVAYEAQLQQAERTLALLEGEMAEYRAERWADSGLAPVAPALPVSLPVPASRVTPGEAAGLAVAGLVATLAVGLAWGLGWAGRRILARVRDIR